MPGTSSGASAIQLATISPRHLRMELDAPGGLAEPERLRTDPAARQLRAAGGTSKA